MKKIVILPLACLAATACPLPATPPAAPAPSEIVAASPSGDWQVIPPEDVFEMVLANGRTITFQLTRDFAPVHVANIRKLVAAHFWDGTSVNRVQENYVVQWGDASEKKPLPAGIGIATSGDYVRPLAGLDFRPCPIVTPMRGASAMRGAGASRATGRRPGCRTASA